MGLSFGSLNAAARTAGAIGVAGGLLERMRRRRLHRHQRSAGDVTQQSVTVYSATTPGSGTTAATQDLLTARPRQDRPRRAPRRRPMPTRSTRPRSSCAATPSTPTTAPSSIRPPNGGYGTLYGPNVDVDRRRHRGRRPDPRPRVHRRARRRHRHASASTMAVQIPDSFNQADAVPRARTSSGSRGVYGAHRDGQRVGPEARLRGRAHRRRQGRRPVRPDRRHRQPHRRHPRHARGRRRARNFAADITDAARAAYNALFPNRLRAEAGALAAQPGEGLGHRHARRGALRASTR